MKKHGGSSRLKLRCKQRTCVNVLQYPPQAQKQRRKRRDSSSDPGEYIAHLQTDFARQCYGPGCVNSARYGSKYCSDVCGTKLATSRIFQVRYFITQYLMLVRVLTIKTALYIL